MTLLDRAPAPWTYDDLDIAVRDANGRLVVQIGRAHV